MASADDINWDDLRYFLRALEAKSLVGAARRLGVEHSTVGRRLAANADLAHGCWVTAMHLSGAPTPFKADIMRENRT